jgi:hypothetical protein
MARRWLRRGIRRATWPLPNIPTARRRTSPPRRRGLPMSNRSRSTSPVRGSRRRPSAARRRYRPTPGGLAGSPCGCWSQAQWVTLRGRRGGPQRRDRRSPDRGRPGSARHLGLESVRAVRGSRAGAVARIRRGIHAAGSRRRRHDKPWHPASRSPHQPRITQPQVRPTPPESWAPDSRKVITV